MSIPRFFARQPVLVNMLMIAILVAGIFVLMQMPQENNPSIDLDMALVIIAYPGASPDDVEKLITLPVEEQVRNLSDIDFINSRSEEGRSVVFIRYEAGLKNFDQSFLDLKTEVDKIKTDLPDDAQDNIFYIKISTNEIWPIVGIAMGGDYSTKGLNKLAKSLRDEILDLDSIAKMDISGLRKREFRVESDRALLEAHGIALQDIVAAIQMGNANLPAGRLSMGRQEFLVRSISELENANDIGDVILRASMEGGTLRVKDVATINDTFEKDESITRLNGKPSVYLRAYMKKEASIVTAVDEIRDLVEKFQKRVPDLELSIRNDNSIPVRESINVLTSNAITGLLLVAILMTLLIGYRSAILAIIGIPFAFLTSFIFLDVTGGTINSLSLFAFILVLGMVVDDAIIIIENVYHHMEQGKPALKAAIEGAEEVMWPVVAAVVTTIAAFLPLLLMEGDVGKFLAVLPIVVTVALIGSLIQSLVVLPSHLADFGKLPKASGTRLGDRLYAWLESTYKKQIAFFLRHRYMVTIGILIATILITVAAAKVLRIEMFPQEESSTEWLIVQLPTGTQLEETDRIINQIEQRCSDISKDDINSVIAIVGYIIDGERWLKRTNGGMLLFEMGDSDKRRDNDLIKNDIRKRFTTIPEIESARFSKDSSGPPTGSPIEMRVAGDDLDNLIRHSERIIDDLKAIKGVTDIESSYSSGKQEIRFLPDRDKMSSYGLSVVALSTFMRTAIDGLEATSFRDSEGDEVKVMVEYKESDRDDVEDLKKMVIHTPLGIAVQLSEIGEFVIQKGPTSISRRNAKRTITVTANVNQVDVNSDEANRIMRKKYETFSERYPGYKVEFGGEAEEQQKSFKSLLQAFVVALVIIYLILGTQFQSFTQPMIVMYTVPFSLIGVAIGLIVQNLTFSIVAAISVVALSGVVVNDSLVLVDFINRARATGMKRYDALIISGTRRMRPILLTTLTTIAGLLPMAIGVAGASKTWQPMAICICWGLAFATFLTLFVIPCTYSIADDWVNAFRRLFKMRSTSEIIQGREIQLEGLTSNENEDELK